MKQNKNEQIWRKKNERFALTLKAQRTRNMWYVDNGFSIHMTRDKNKFISLKENMDGTMSFGNDRAWNIIGIGTITLGSKEALEKDVLLDENMNHNFS